MVFLWDETKGYGVAMLVTTMELLVGVDLAGEREMWKGFKSFFN